MIEGNRNFGVWNPPTGMDSVRYSEQINFNLVVKSNNYQLDKETSIRQSFGKNIEQFENPDLNLIVYLNNNNLKIFTGMIQQGWGGNFKSIPSLTPPSTSPSTSSALPTSFPSLRTGNLNAKQIDRAMQFKVCGSFCTTLYNLWEGVWSTQVVCWNADLGWVSNTWNDGLKHDTLDSWYLSFYWNSTGMPEDYFVVDTATRAQCFPAISSIPLSTLPPGEFNALDVDLVMASW